MNIDEFNEMAGALIADQDFERIDLSLREPNIFSALAIERMEIRHSNFLAYLLNPSENHGLRDIVLRKFLRVVFSDSRSKGRTIFDADMIGLREIDIRREWRNIDLALILPEDVVIIENKVDTKDHSGQLARYRKVAEETFPNQKLHFVYLTPEGSDPLDREQSDIWINYSYHQVADIIERILEIHHESVSEKIQNYLYDYLTTIKRKLLMNDSLNDLAIKVYQSHRAAFDFIFENRPDPASQLYPYFKKILEENGFSIGSRNKGYVRFSSPRLMDRLPRSGQGWPDREPFLFEFDYYWNNKKAVFKAVIAPGDEELRQRIFGAAKGLIDIYKEPKGKQWLVFFSRSFSFDANEIVNEEESKIIHEIRHLVDEVKVQANIIIGAIENSLPDSQ